MVYLTHNQYKLFKAICIKISTAEYQLEDESIAILQQSRPVPLRKCESKPSTDIP